LYLFGSTPIKRIKRGKTMTKNEIIGLISILETKYEQTENTVSRFVIWQEIKSLKQQLESLKGVN
jgi:hypothetical protein